MLTTSYSASEPNLATESERTFIKFRRPKSAEISEVEEFKSISLGGIDNVKYTKASTKLLQKLLESSSSVVKRCEKKKGSSYEYFNDVIWKKKTGKRKKQSICEERFCANQKTSFFHENKKGSLSHEEEKEESVKKEILEDLGCTDPCQSSKKSRGGSLFATAKIFDPLKEKTEKTLLAADPDGITRKKTKEVSLDESVSTWIDSDIRVETLRLLHTVDNNDGDFGDCLEDDEIKTSSDIRRKNKPFNVNGSDCCGTIFDLKDIHSLLDDVEKKSDLLACKNASDEMFSSPRLEELIDRNPVDLAHQILTLKMKAEDQKTSIELLRKNLSEMKIKSESTNEEHEKLLNKANAEAESLIRRHQKLIRQLLNEKKDLNKTITELILDLKLKEEKFNKELKALKEKHQLDMRRSREAQIVADRIKREKWMAVKIEKIKEMTIKGLEPEMSRMAVRQQQEMAELKTLQKAEMEAVELRATRRASQLMDELRVELLKEKATAIENETENLRKKMEKDFEKERNRLETTQRALKKKLEEHEEKLAKQESENRQRLTTMKKKADEEKDKLILQFEESLKNVRSEHLTEMKKIRETAEREKEIFELEYKKIESAKFLELETELRKRYKRERDKDIEKIIDAMEKESVQLKLEMHESSENKLKRLEEKLKKDIKEAEANETFAREKLSQVKLQLSEREQTIEELNSKVRSLQTESNLLKKRCEELTLERDDLEKMICKKFEEKLADATKDKQILEREIITLKENHARELARKDDLSDRKKKETEKEIAKVYKRIQTMASKKDKIIESLRKENQDKTERCIHLEILLENQKNNY